MAAVVCHCPPLIEFVTDCSEEVRLGGVAQCSFRRTAAAGMRVLASCASLRLQACARLCMDAVHTMPRCVDQLC